MYPHDRGEIIHIRPFPFRPLRENYVYCIGPERERERERITNKKD